MLSFLSDLSNLENFIGIDIKPNNMTTIEKAKQLTNEGHKIFVIEANAIWYHDKVDGKLRCIYRSKN
jgi:hypothetical protein